MTACIRFGSATPVDWNRTKLYMRHFYSQAGSAKFSPAAEKHACKSTSRLDENGRAASDHRL